MAKIKTGRFLIPLEKAELTREDYQNISEHIEQLEEIIQNTENLSLFLHRLSHQGLIDFKEGSFEANYHTMTVISDPTSDILSKVIITPKKQ